MSELVCMIALSSVIVQLFFFVQVAPPGVVLPIWVLVAACTLLLSLAALLGWKVLALQQQVAWLDDRLDALIDDICPSSCPLSAGGGHTS